VNGELVTPAPTENILLGITRDTIIQLAQKELGIQVRERQIDRTELYTADEIFLCGTGAQIAPVIEVDHNPVGTGNIGEISQKLQDLYFDIVRGKNKKYKEWCTPVY
jgi:branched-chain amino acid aminotransferase